MGSLSRTDRCGRFIREFGADYVRRLGFGLGAKLVVVAEQLAFDEANEVVRYPVVLRPEGSEEEVRLMLDPVFCGPDSSLHDQVSRVADDLEMDAAQVRRRFREAGLVGRRTG
jgi:hypothetical protein